MPLPVAALLQIGAPLLQMIPWVQKNQQKADQIIPALVQMAQQVAPGAVNEQAAVQAVQTNPQVRAAFQAQAAAQWADIAPMLEFEAGERKAARGFFTEATSEGPAWRQIGVGFVVAVLSLIIVIGGGSMFWSALNSPQLDPGQKGLILGALLTAFATVVGFWFGGSASGRQKDQTIADQAKR